MLVLATIDELAPIEVFETPPELLIAS